ncbi:hypothetical protein ATB93_10990 [Sphingomonas sp. WG]|nr:hypothetical protein ATB93_10990 [Sphingomonas sp. WG]
MFPGALAGAQRKNNMGVIVARIALGIRNMDCGSPRKAQPAERPFAKLLHHCAALCRIDVVRQVPDDAVLNDRVGAVGFLDCFEGAPASRDLLSVFAHIGHDARIDHHIADAFDRFVA